MACDCVHTSVSGVRNRSPLFMRGAGLMRSFASLSGCFGDQEIEACKLFLCLYRVNNNEFLSCILSLASANLPFVYFDNHQSDYNRNQKHSPSLDVSGQDPNALRAVSQLQRVLNELRLFRLIRRFRDIVRHRLERRCELRQFVVLRMQYLIRARNRLRSAIRIQRFVRKQVINRAACTGSESVKHAPRSSTV